jgi:hypothetical protein
MVHKGEGATGSTSHYCFLFIVAAEIYIKQQAEYEMMFMNKFQHSY